MKKIVFLLLVVLIASCSFWTDGWDVKYSADGEGKAVFVIDGNQKTVELPYEEIKYYSVGDVFSISGDTYFTVKYREAYNHLWSSYRKSNGEEIIGTVRR